MTSRWIGIGRLLAGALAAVLVGLWATPAEAGHGARRIHHTGGPRHPVGQSKKRSGQPGVAPAATGGAGAVAPSRSAPARTNPNRTTRARPA